MRHKLLSWSGMTLAALTIVCVCDQNRSLAAPITAPGSIPDYFETPNWANSPPLRKFIDTLAPLGCTTPTTLGQCLPIAVADQATYPGSDYYEIDLVEYRERMHSDLPAVTLNGGSKINATSGGTKLRGYRQFNTAVPSLLEPHYLGPIIVATKDRPVRVKFTNKLPTGANGNLFVPSDTTIMGSGGYETNYNPITKARYSSGTPNLTGNFTENRATLHLHGGRTPWISDGTPHQWTAPVGETAAAAYPKGMSTSYVPDMWFDASGNTIAACAGKTTCATAGATNNPGTGSMTFYYTNQQSARLLFYHDHAWGITRLNVYVGEAAGYVIADPVEQAMINGGQVNGQGRTYTAGTIPALADTLPLIIQDKTFVDPTTILNTDPTWAWGSTAPNVVANPTTMGQGMNPVKGDLWWPHVYMSAQNPFNPDLSGINAMGRWHYGPWFFPATPICGSSANAVKPYCVEFGPVPNEHYLADPNCSPTQTALCTQPPERPGTPNVSWGAEAFLDTMAVNGTVYPKANVAPQKYRLRILNASHDRFLNLQLYQADSTVNANTDPVAGPICTAAGGCATDTEVKMVTATPRPACSATITTNCTCATPGVNVPAGCFPDYWAADGREGGVPDPALRGPAMIQIGTEGGFLPAPVVLNNQPVVWNTDPTTFNFGNVSSGTLLLGPAERADVIVDFTNFAGKTLILYNDAPTAFPALDPHYDYYTGAPDRTAMGGSPAIPPGVGPNVRTVMQIVVSGTGGTAPVDDYNPATLSTLQTAFATSATPGAFAAGQEPIVVGQTAYNTTYNRTFPSTWPNWGISRISDTKLSFQKYDGTQVSNFPMKPKAIHDEMGASFDDYGRMSAKLGLEVPFVNAAIANFILQNFVDPATEQVNPNQIQIWKITHNGVDTHPIHFHLFDVQLLNRVGWDGFIRLPDPNELGWKDTIRVSPLEDTIVALRPTTPRVPFALPDSIRPLNPSQPLGSNMGFSNIDTTTGNNLATPTLNAFTNYGLEYVWHCHILSHEENDMMRSVIFNTKAMTDILWRNTSNGQNALWYMDGITKTGSATLPATADQNWKIAGRGDFNGDGKPDILWYNTSNGQLSVWYMDDTKRLGSASLPTNTDTTYQVAGVGDFNNDGKADVVWRHQSNGQNAVWYMNNTVRTGTATLPVLTGAAWKIVGIADFNADGKPDLLWRNTSTGQNAVWYMNNTIRSGSANLPTQADLAWKIVGTGDFNGDVYTDILWRNTTNGQNAVWYMNGATRTGIVSLLTNTDQNWKIMGNYYVYP